MNNLMLHTLATMSIKSNHERIIGDLIPIISRYQARLDSVSTRSSASKKHHIPLVWWFFPEDGWRLAPYPPYEL
jgi:hypothetical protein